MTSGWRRRMARLRCGLIEEQRGILPMRMLDCCAHMLLYVDEPEAMCVIGLDHLVERLSAARADVGPGSPTSPTYRAATTSAPARGVPAVVGQSLPNRHEALQVVWRTSGVVTLDVVHDPVFAGLRPTILGLGTKSKMARRLDSTSGAFGLVCVDEAGDARRWTGEETSYLDIFSRRVLAPLLDEAWRRERGWRGYEALTEAEKAVAWLAAEGLSYKQIARRLGKSPNTVDNQLRSVRAKLGVDNRVGLALLLDV